MVYVYHCSCFDHLYVHHCQSVGVLREWRLIMATTMQSNSPVNTSPWYSVQLRKFGVASMITMIALIFVIVYLLPFVNMALLSIQTGDQFVTSATGPILPVD